MKMKLTYTVLLAFLFVMSAASLQAQTSTVTGKVTDKDQPQAGVQVTYKSSTTGRQIKMKTNKKGEFMSIGVPIDSYTVTVVDSSGKTVFSQEGVRVGPVADESQGNILNIDLTNGAQGTFAGGASVGTSVAGRTQEFAGEAGTAGNKSASGTKTEGSKVSKEEIERMKAQNAKAENINGLIKQYQDAANAKDWKAAITPLQGMVAADPERWEYFQALGNAQFNDGQYEEAVKSLDQGVKVADGFATGATPKDPKNPNSDPAKAKAGEGQMLSTEGNAYLKLKKNPEAVAAFTKAAELDPNPGVAFFNLCATQYNTGNTKGALEACDKAIAADPNRADAYFIKGSLLMASSSMDKEGKIQAVPGTADALNKYLQLAPDGPHAEDVKQMLAYIGSKVETTYKSTKKK